MGAMPRKGVVFSCLDAATGAMLWQQSFDQGGIYNNPDPHATPVVDGERVYGITLKGMLYCLQTADGQVLWKKDLVAEFKTKGSWYGWVASPVIAGDLLLINASDKGIALNKHTGAPVWVTAEDRLTYQGDGPNGSLVTPLVCSLGGRTCALLVTNTLFLAVDLATGSPLWSLRHGEAIHSVTDCAAELGCFELTWTSSSTSGPQPSWWPALGAQFDIQSSPVRRVPVRRCPYDGGLGWGRLFMARLGKRQDAVSLHRLGHGQSSLGTRHPWRRFGDRR
jgi:hypothetical protein